MAPVATLGEGGGERIILPAIDVRFTLGTLQFSRILETNRPKKYFFKKVVQA